jgi:serine/threonine-protein kinase
MTNRLVEPSWTIPRPGDTLAGKYVVEGLCGRGGLAVVLSAMHAGLAQRVAIKMLLPEWAGDGEVVQRFVREGRAATRIKSEHVVRVFDVDTLDNGAPYLVLEYLEGHNLDDVVAMWGPLPVDTAIDWILQAVEAIAEAHSYGIIHRDLKPANLFLTQRADTSACIKVIDFGLSKLTDPRMSGDSAKLTRPTDVMGSPHYMAPEQLRSACDADARADLWALGAVLHELLTGQPPFRGATMPELCATVLTAPPPRVSAVREDVPPEIEEAVMRCLEKDPCARFSSAAEMARALAPFGTDLARRSCARIERVLEAGGRMSELTPLPSRALDIRAEIATRPSQRPGVQREANMAGQVLVGAFLILLGLGVGGFLGMYAAVHGGERNMAMLGVAAPQGTSVATALLLSQASPPMATAVLTPASTTPVQVSATVSPSKAAEPVAVPLNHGAAPGAPVVRPPSPVAPAQRPLAVPRIAPAATMASGSLPAIRIEPTPVVKVEPTPKIRIEPAPSPAPRSAASATSEPSGDELFDGRK